MTSLRRWVGRLASICLLAVAGPSCAKPATGGRVDPPVVQRQPVDLVQVTSLTELLVRASDGLHVVPVQGVHADGACHPEAHLAWARQILPPGTPLWVERSDHGVPLRIWFAWHGQRIDWSLLLLRLGQAMLPVSGRPARVGLRPYVFAQQEARAEGRGIWGECGRRHIQFGPAAAAIGVSPQLLLAMAIVESGIGQQPWPWTLNVAGHSYFFLTRSAALAAAARLQSQHFDLFDVGILQVNWHYHRSRFPDLATALDPESNQRVAAQILAEQRARSGSLAEAVARYHSADPVRGQRYLARVQAVLQSLCADRSAGRMPDAGNGWAMRGQTTGRQPNSKQSNSKRTTSKGGAG